MSCLLKQAVSPVSTSLWMDNRIDAPWKNLQQLFDEYVEECRYSSLLSRETLKGYTAVFRLFVRNARDNPSEISDNRDGDWIFQAPSNQGKMGK